MGCDPRSNQLDFVGDLDPRCVDTDLSRDPGIFFKMNSLFTVSQYLLLQSIRTAKNKM